MRHTQEELRQFAIGMMAGLMAFPCILLLMCWLMDVRFQPVFTGALK